jgi:MauM/NapG family ferredoxin protein
MTAPGDRPDEGMSRRELLRGGFLRAARRAAEAVPLTIEGAARHEGGPQPAQPPPRHRPFPVIRPPGAVDEEEFLAGCTRCNACIEACPHDAITLAPARFRHAAGTPMIDPARQPCLMCADVPCCRACEPGVLLENLPRRIAMANLLTYNCIAWQGGFCSVCSEHCPQPGALTMEGGRPVIHEDICTGCGVCHHVCPAPTNAIAIMPLQSRPSGSDADEEQR